MYNCVSSQVHISPLCITSLKWTNSLHTLSYVQLCTYTVFAWSDATPLSQATPLIRQKEGLVNVRIARSSDITCLFITPYQRCFKRWKGAWLVFSGDTTMTIDFFLTNPLFKLKQLKWQQSVAMTCHTIQWETQTCCYHWRTHTDPSLALPGEAAGSLKFKSLDLSAIGRVNMECLVGHHTNDVTPGIKITESDWMREYLITEQLVVHAFTTPPFPRIGGVACETNTAVE